MKSEGIKAVEMSCTQKTKHRQLPENVLSDTIADQFLQLTKCLKAEDHKRRGIHHLSFNFRQERCETACVSLH